MTYHLYGEKFKELRTQKQLPLSYFEEIGMNKGDLSRFEHGKQMIGFERLDVMLQQMNVSLAEYELIINNFVPDFQEAFLNDVDEADFNQDKPKLTKLYEEARETGYGLLAIATKARYDKLEEKEITYVLDFLNKIKEWGYFELSVLYFVLDDLSTLELRKVFRDFETKSHNYYGLPKYSRRILQIAYRAVVILGARGEQEFVNQILKQTEHRTKAGIDIYIENLRRLTLGVNHYYFENKDEGMRQINKSLEIFRFLEHEELAHYYENRIKAFLN